MKHSILIIGLGLIGGSIAKALKASGNKSQIIGIDSSAEACALLRDAGAVDHTYPGMNAEAFQNATTIIIATPPDSWKMIAASLHTYSMPDVTLIMDVGSIKHYANECFGTLPHFVAAHPIAGSEFSGAAFSTAELFRSKRIILSPAANTQEKDVMNAEAFWKSLGMHPVTLDAQFHDRIYAYVSHLPQVVAYALAYATLGAGHAGEPYLKFLRLSGSSPSLWVSIIQHNPYVADAAENVLQIIVHMITELRTGELPETQSLSTEIGRQLLPRIIASSLISAVTLEEKRSQTRLSAYAGSGFADMVYPAMTPPEDDLALISTHTNEVISLLLATEEALRLFLIAIKKAQWDELETFFNRARNAYVLQLEFIV